MDAKRRIIIALDVPSKQKALSLMDQLNEAEIFKVGMELFTSEGPPLLEEIQRLGKKAFLDLKYHDIPNTVAEAVRAATRHGVYMLTLHSSGGGEMMARAARVAAEEADKKEINRPLLLGVTVLTSLKKEQMGEIGISGEVEEAVLRLARLAQSAGMDGVVCSPQEIAVIRRELGRNFLIVTPGIRPLWAASQDQKRIMTPSEALRLGADSLVIGRPVTAAESPHSAFLKIVDELENAADSPDSKNSS